MEAIITPPPAKKAKSPSQKKPVSKKAGGKKGARKSKVRDLAGVGGLGQVQAGEVMSGSFVLRLLRGLRRNIWELLAERLVQLRWAELGDRIPVGKGV